MPKYIELSSLLEKLQTTSIVTDDLYGMGIMSGMDAARKIVAEQPIIDAEPVVRCQHCKHHDEGENYISNDGKFVKEFAKITEYLEVNDNFRNIVLCHYPIPCFKNHYYGWYHLYGHVHNSFEYQMMEHDKYLMQELYGKQCQMFNVGAMMPYMDYTPRTLDEILKGAS